MDNKLLQSLLIISCLALLFGIIATAVELAGYHG
jgi:hypothetical protein